MKKWVIAGAVLVVAIAVNAIAHFTLSALPEPGLTETYLATKVRHYLVHKSSRRGIPPSPREQREGIKEGERLFATDCAACHGTRGYNLTEAGRWMYPRAADLTSRDSQAYSDQEIFWIIKNGIRFSGMPAFGKVESDERIWDLVLYFRTLPKAVPRPQVAQK